MSKARAEIEITANDSKLAAGLARARTTMSNWASMTASGVGKAFSGSMAAVKWANNKTSPGAVAKHALGNLASGAASKGIDALIEAATASVDLDKTLTQIRIAGEMSAGGMADFGAEVKRASAATGVSAQELANGGLALVSFTGHADSAKAAMGLMAETVEATGASAADVAGIMATFDKNMNLPVDQWRSGLDMLIKQAHLGGVETRDLAGSFTAVAAASATIFKGGTTLKSLSQVSAMAQVIQDSTHNADETSTRMIEMFNEFRKPATVKRLRAAGVEPFDAKTGKIKEMLPLLEELKKKNLSVEQTSAIFRDVRGSAAISYLLEHLDTVNKINDASQNSNAIAVDGAIAHESASGRIAVAMNGIKLAVAAAFTPERIASFASALEDVANNLGPIMDKFGWVADKFASLHAAGRAARKAIVGDETNNPYRDSSSETFDKLRAIDEETDPALKRDKVSAFVARSADAKAYDNADFGDDSKPTAAGVKLAFAAKNATGGPYDGIPGTNAAGVSYLENAGKDSQGAALIAKYQAEALAAMVDKMVSGVAAAVRDGMAKAPAPVVKLGDNQVAASVGKATHYARNKP